MFLTPPFSVLLLVLLNQVTSNEIEDKFLEAGIVPDVIDEAPSRLVNVTYPSGVVYLGTEFIPAQVATTPDITWEADSSLYYTLINVDPDANNSRKHWLVGNIKGVDVASGNVNVVYAGARPPQGTGIHRYVFLVYQQNGVIDYSNETTDRPNFSVQDFARRYDLGNAYAGNFYVAQYAG